MKRTLLFASLILQICISNAQQTAIEEFLIGADFVTNASQYPYAWTPIGSVNDFPQAAWLRLRDIGIMLPTFHLDSAAVGTNFPASLFQDANQTYGTGRVAIHDQMLMKASRWERRYYQVESDEHFATIEGAVSKMDEFIPNLSLASKTTAGITDYRF